MNLARLRALTLVSTLLSAIGASAALAEETEEKGAAFVDALEADLDHVLVEERVLLCDSPAEVDIHQPQLARYLQAQPPSAELARSLYPHPR